jgi:uncharacterized protein (TIGR02996 family)
MDRARPATGDEAALLGAVREAPEDDAPRLVYADWLDEHGDADRAAFIRTQCRLAAASPAEEEWVDLTERERELADRLSNRYRELWPPSPRRFFFPIEFLSEHEPPYRRGFPYFIDCQLGGGEWTAEETARVIAEVGRLIETTTVRGLHLYDVPRGSLQALLAAPATAGLSGLAFRLHPREEDHSPAYRLLAGSPAVRGVRHLGLHGAIPPGGIAALAGAQSLSSVRRLALHDLSAAGGDLRALTAAEWFRRVEHLRIVLEHTRAAAMLPALGQFSNLHTLHLALRAPDALPQLAAGRFPALGRLLYWGTLDLPSAATLAGARFPRLAVLEVPRLGMKNDALRALMRADWFAGLRVLSLGNNALGDRGVAALAAHPVARALRVLRLGDNPFARAGLAAIARPGAFPSLTTLDLHTFDPHTALKRKATEADVAAFLAAFSSPRLRHLDLGHWPVGDTGAEALARSPTFAQLTRLGLESCGIGEAGARALFASPHLQRLVCLDLSHNKIGRAADALLDPAVMPRLVDCRLLGTDIPQATAAKLRERKDRSVTA